MTEFSISGLEMTEVGGFYHFLAADSFVYTVDQKHTLYVSGLTNSTVDGANTSLYALDENENGANGWDVSLSAIGDQGLMMSEIFTPTATWDADTSRYAITFTVTEENKQAGVTHLMLRLASYSDSSWGAGPTSQYFVIALQESTTA